MPEQDTGPPIDSALEPMLRKLEYWHNLDVADQTALLRLTFTVKSVPQYYALVREGDCASHSCLLLSGFAIRSKIVAHGLRQIVAIHMRGEMVDLQNSLLGRADHAVEMLTAGKVAMIPRDEISRIAFERPAIVVRCGSTRWSMHRFSESGSRMLVGEMLRRALRICSASSPCGSKLPG